MALILALLTAAWPGALFGAAYDEPPAQTGLYMTADAAAASPGDTVSFTVNFNILSGLISGYTATRVAVILPLGLEYSSAVAYVGGSPMFFTSMPITTPAGTSVVMDFDNLNPGGAQIIVSARVSSSASGYDLTARAELFLQPYGGEMPNYYHEQAAVTVQLAPRPVTPQIVRVTFNTAGGTRVGGGALVQAVATGGAASEPYVFRQGYVFMGWDTPFNNVQSDLYVTALWMPESNIGTIPIEPPIYQFVNGFFVGGRNAFTQTSHVPMIFYAERHWADFSHAEIDGRLLTPGSHYIATAGRETAAPSTAIHLRASYLNTLSAGTHNLRVYFRGDVYAYADFIIVRYYNNFYDVSANDWFYAGVGAMNASELLRGVSDTHFDPYGSMTRGMVVTLLYRFAGEPPIGGLANPFPDVAYGQYYTNAVIWAAANGIVTGHDTGYFAPGDIMTNEQFAAVLYRYQDALGTTPMPVLADRTYSDFEQISLYARGAVNRLTMQGVYRDLPSDPQNRFLPRAAVTRAGVAAVMRHWIESIGW